MCELCGRTDVKLEVHHVNKVKNLTPPPNEKVEQMQEALKPLSDQDLKDIAVYLNGLK